MLAFLHVSLLPPHQFLATISSSKCRLIKDRTESRGGDAWGVGEVTRCSKQVWSLATLGLVLKRYALLFALLNNYSLLKREPLWHLPSGQDLPGGHKIYGAHP